MTGCPIVLHRVDPKMPTYGTARILYRYASKCCFIRRMGIVCKDALHLSYLMQMEHFLSSYASLMFWVRQTYRASPMIVQALCVYALSKPSIHVRCVGWPTLSTKYLPCVSWCSFYWTKWFSIRRNWSTRPRLNQTKNQWHCLALCFRHFIYV